MKHIQLIINNDSIERYAEYYFSIHSKARNMPIPFPYHESINKWMIMRRPAMNALKQRWKDYIVWFIEQQGYSNLRIDKCGITFTTFYPTNRRHDVDNSCPKFILDGFVESGFIIDDDCCHLMELGLKCGVDKNNPRTEIDVFYEN